MCNKSINSKSNGFTVFQIDIMLIHAALVFLFVLEVFQWYNFGGQDRGKQAS